MRKAIESAILIILMIFVAGLFAGYKLFAGSDSTLAQKRQVELQRQQMELDKDRRNMERGQVWADRIAPIKATSLSIVLLGGAAGMAGVAILGLGYGSYQAALILRRQANTFYRDRNGLPPLIREVQNGTVLIHDPLRAPTAGLLVDHDGAQHLSPAELEAAQQQALMMAGRTETARALMSGTDRGLMATMQGLLGQVAVNAGAGLLTDYGQPPALPRLHKQLSDYAQLIEGEVMNDDDSDA